MQIYPKPSELVTKLESVFLLLGTPQSSKSGRAEGKLSDLVIRVDNDKARQTPPLPPKPTESERRREEKHRGRGEQQSNHSVPQIPLPEPPKEK